MLKRIFITNWKTTLSAAVILAIVGGRVGRFISSQEALELMGLATAAGLVFAKDGVRDDQRVAPEDTDAPQ